MCNKLVIWTSWLFVRRKASFEENHRLNCVSAICSLIEQRKQNVFLPSKFYPGDFVRLEKKKSCSIDRRAQLNAKVSAKESFSTSISQRIIWFRFLMKDRVLWRGNKNEKNHSLEDFSFPTMKKLFIAFRRSIDWWSMDHSIKALKEQNQQEIFFSPQQREKNRRVEQWDSYGW